MTRDNDNLDDIPSMVPERDEMVHHRKRKRGTSASGSSAQSPDVYSSRTSGPVIFLLCILLLGMGGSGAAGYYFYMQGEVTKAELLKSQTRLGQLESRLNLVDEAAEQSSLNLVERVNLNFSEIDKLWAARNTLRTDAADLKSSLTSVQSATKTLQTTVAANSKTLNDNIGQIQARIAEINQNFAGMDNLGSQLTLLNADLNRVKTAMSLIDEEVVSQLKSYEADIESINRFRFQTNQDISRLQDSVNQLQQRLGQAPAATSGL